MTLLNKTRINYGKLSKTNYTKLLNLKKRIFKNFKCHSEIKHKCVHVLRKGPEI